MYCEGKMKSNSREFWNSMWNRKNGTKQEDTNVPFKQALLFSSEGGSVWGPFLPSRIKLVVAFKQTKKVSFLLLWVVQTHEIKSWISTFITLGLLYERSYRTPLSVNARLLFVKSFSFGSCRIGTQSLLFFFWFVYYSWSFSSERMSCNDWEALFDVLFLLFFVAAQYSNFHVNFLVSPVLKHRPRSLKKRTSFLVNVKTNLERNESVLYIFINWTFSFFSIYD